MLFYTHLVFSFLIGLFLIDYISVSNKILYFVFLILFSSVPDIDKSNSKIGKKFGLFSKLIYFIFGHRKFFHSFLFIVAFYLILSIFSNLISIVFLIATISHLILDALTPEGIVPFYPLSYRFKGVIRTGSFVEKIIFLVIIILIVIKLGTGHI